MLLLLLCYLLKLNKFYYRILSFPIHTHFPSVQALEVHLENYQRMYINPEDVDPENPPVPRVTTLMEFFRLCAEDDFARTLKYIEVPNHYTWANGKWSIRKKGHQLGRIHTVSPNYEEAFCLRLLLNEVPGPTSFDDIKTVDGSKKDTFKEACRVRGLLDDDSHLHEAMSEAADRQSATRMIDLFVIILVHCQPSDPLLLWNNHK